MKTTEFHKLVRENGWMVLRQTGSHVIYKKGSVIYPVPYHGAKELGTGLEKKMRKEMGLKNR
jgi:predicted RNA binding protein YcfA (HicA-like mRNA interferase family)